MSGAASRSICSTDGNWRPSLSAIESNCSATEARSGWAKIVRTAAATIAASPWAQRHGGDRVLEPLVGVGDHQAHTGETPGPQAAQNGRPEGAVLRVADGEAEHLAVAVDPYAGGDHRRLGDGPRALVGLQEEQVREGIADRPGAELAHLLIELGADP